MNYHLSFIMDGNRRWSKQQNTSYYEAYKKGATVFRDCIEYVYTSPLFGVVSFFCFSQENRGRGSGEKGLLWKLFEGFDFLFLEQMHIELRFIGEIPLLPYSVQKSISYWESKLSFSNAKKRIFLFVCYGGEQDISQSISQVRKQQIGLSLNQVKSHLLSKEVPLIDCLVRTGGEKRLSNFDLWDLESAEMFFLDCLWPNLTTDDLDNVSKQFRLRRQILKY